jgi:threonine dehydrogenase-like Zn-dependent dehydrogenase
MFDSGRNTKVMNQQIRTWQISDGIRDLKTSVVEKPLRALQPGEILIEVLFVPIHGSFWLASHPAGIHPRYEEFLSDGGFVFGNGGVGRVIAVAERCKGTHPGDYVSVMGHLPCNNDSCYACHVLHRYTECDFGEGMIVGHGRGAPDGTFSRFCIFPESACEVCFTASNPPSEKELMPYMFGFLLADVRNAMARNPESLQKKRLLLIGAGHSSHLAACILLHYSPMAKIIVVDTLQERLESIVQIAPESVRTIALPQRLVDGLNTLPPNQNIGAQLAAAIEEIESRMQSYFGHQKCDLVFDGSSGNSIPLWADSRVLGPGTHCVLFGFGSDRISLGQECLQISGLRILTSRGVGNVENRQAVLELIRLGAANNVLDRLIRDSRKLEGLDQALAFIEKQYELPWDLYRVPHAFIAPNEFSPKQKDPVRMSLWASNGLSPNFGTKKEVQKA